MHFEIKSYLKSTRNHTDKQALNGFAEEGIYLITFILLITLSAQIFHNYDLVPNPPLT